MSVQDCASLLVPSGRPGQRYTLDSLVAYKAALCNLPVYARILIKEEEHTFAKTASLTSAPLSLCPLPPPPLTFAGPQCLLVLVSPCGADPQFPQPAMQIPLAGITPPTRPCGPHLDCNRHSRSCPVLCMMGTECPCYCHKVRATLIQCWVR